MSFNNLKLEPQLMQAIEACGYEEPTPIQREAIPEILDGNDILASAPTGTGKTAAFVLPALQILSKPPKKEVGGPRMLVLTPTRELASQIDQHMSDLSQFRKCEMGSIIGGMPYPPQIKLLKKPLDMLVATPGRLMDHMQQGRVNFDRLEIFVLDEADRMLDLGFIDAIRFIASRLPKKRQTLLFSATLEGEVLSISRTLLKDPVQIQLATNRQKHELIHQRLHHADDLVHKHRLLSRYLESDDVTQALVFTATKKTADRLTAILQAQGHNTTALHGDLPQKARKRALEKLRDGKVKALIATDLAARGLDVKGISHVINFELPSNPEDYIHRIGRTGRAGVAGSAVTLIDPAEWLKWAEIERITGHAAERSTLPGLEPEKPAPLFPAAGRGPVATDSPRISPLGLSRSSSRRRKGGRRRSAASR